MAACETSDNLTYQSKIVVAENREAPRRNVYVESSHVLGVCA